jgi:CDP-6-deoxy-D-xylo-4-hexulose-3-dehydrase
LAATDLIMNRTFWVGVYPGMAPGMIEFMIETIRRFVKR